MATIYRPKPKPKDKKNQANNKLRHKFYASREWKATRDNYLSNHPLDEIYESFGKVLSANVVHHIKSFIVGDEIDYGLALSEDNLMSLNEETHSIIHKYFGKTNGTNFPLYKDMFDIIQRDGYLSKTTFIQLSELHKDEWSLPTEMELDLSF